MRHYLVTWLLSTAPLTMLLANSSPCCLVGESAPPPARKSTAELIEQLGSKSFPTREEATHLLMEREEAIPALRKAAKSSDTEVARRASEILSELVRKGDRRAQERLVSLAKYGELDQLAELLVRRRDWGDEEDACWRLMAELGGKVLDLEKKEFGKVYIKDPDRVPFYDFRRYKESQLPRVIASPRPNIREARPDRPSTYFVRGEEVSAFADINNSLIVSSGAVRTCGFHSSIILAGGSVEIEGAHTSVIITDGEFRTRPDEFRRPGYLHNCVVIAREAIHCPEARNCLFISAGPVHVPKNARGYIQNSVIRENEPLPLGFVRFFDPAKTGIAVGAAKDGVTVKDVKDGKPFARAGLRPGDLLVAVDDTATDSPEGFRKVLRRKMAEGGEAIFKVRRDKETLEIRVRCQD